MQQLSLDVRLVQAPSFDNFVVGPNIELITQLKSIVSGKRPAKCLFIWGEAGTGKSHLMGAVKHALTQAESQEKDNESGQEATRADRQDLVASSVESALQSVSKAGPMQLATRVAILDDCQNLDAQAQIDWFTMFINQAADPQAMLIASADQAPFHLNLRPDFRTRLGSGLIFQLKRLDDDQKAEALRQHAASRQIALPEELLRYLLRHYPRDIRFLMGILDNLDRFAFERKRALSLPLLRDMEGKMEGTSTQKMAVPTAIFKPD
jgi:DnaA-homolog protein